MYHTFMISTLVLIIINYQWLFFGREYYNLKKYTMSTCNSMPTTSSGHEVSSRWLFLNIVFGIHLYTVLFSCHVVGPNDLTIYIYNIYEFNRYHVHTLLYIQLIYPLTYIGTHRYVWYIQFELKYINNSNCTDYSE